jgi:hypothetical protein
MPSAWRANGVISGLQLLNPAGYSDQTTYVNNLWDY